MKAYMAFFNQKEKSSIPPLWLKHSNHDEGSQLNQTYQGETWDVVSELEETHITLLS
jgi:hypothetical protein